MTRRPTCSFLILLPPGAEWSRPGAELSGKWHCPGSSSGWAGRASEGCGQAGRGWAGDRRGLRGAAPRPAQSRQPHLPQTTFPVLFVRPYACLWMSCLAASPSAGARLPSAQGTAQKGSPHCASSGVLQTEWEASAGLWGQWKSWLSESGSSSCPRAPSRQEEQGTQTSSC